MKDYSKDFNKQIVSSLQTKGIKIVGASMLPDSNGSFLNSELGYQLNDNGCSKIRTYLQVKQLATK